MAVLLSLHQCRTMHHVGGSHATLWVQFLRLFFSYSCLPLCAFPRYISTTVTVKFPALPRTRRFSRFFDLSEMMREQGYPLQ